jgi:N-acetylglucosaminyldiphosphoundecaprenol N-acetyl-beta-D-mannosaminyltransferase
MDSQPPFTAASPSGRATRPDEVSAVVSVVIPTIGRPSLKAAIESALQQGRLVREILVVNDSGATLDGFQDPRVRIIDAQGGVGAAAARQCGLAASGGEFVAFLDDDDEWLDGHLEDAVNVLRTHPAVDVYLARAEVITNGVRSISPRVVYHGRCSLISFLYGWRAFLGRRRRVPTPTVVARRARVEATPMDHQMATFEDIAWLLDLEANGCTFFQSKRCDARVFANTARENARMSTEVELGWASRLNALQHGAGERYIALVVGRRLARRGDPDWLREVSRGYRASTPMSPAPRLVTLLFIMLAWGIRMAKPTVVAGHDEARTAPDPVTSASPVDAGRVWIGGLPIDRLTMAESVERALQLIHEGPGHQHVVLNAAKVVSAQSSGPLAESVRNADIVNADGQSVVWASRILRDPLPERVAGIDFMEQLIQASIPSGLRVGLLGATQEVVDRVAEILSARGVSLSYKRNGFWAAEDEEALVKDITATGTNILFVGIPSPAKELFVARWLSSLDVNLVVGVGGSFDVIAGKTSRAPLVLQRMGIEWLWRLMQEPRRMFKRYLVGNSQFTALVFRQLRHKYAHLRPSSPEHEFGPPVNADSQPRPPVKMSDQVFKDASTSAKLLAASRRHPLQPFKGLRGLPGLTRLIRSLPSLVVPMSEVDLPIAERLQRGRRLPGMRRLRLCQAVLPLEATQKRYLTGKSRQALRTNLSRARDLGITCAVVDTEDDKRALGRAMSKDLHEFDISDEDMFRFPQDTWMEARSSEGEQIAMALLSQSSSYGLLIRLFARPDHPASSQARFALHSAVVEHVRANGGQYLLVEGKGPLFLEPGLQYFQHLNGYRLMNVRLGSAQSS